jgi:hypothetical protein
MSLRQMDSDSWQADECLDSLDALDEVNSPIRQIQGEYGSLPASTGRRLLALWDWGGIFRPADDWPIRLPQVVDVDGRE